MTQYTTKMAMLIVLAMVCTSAAAEDNPPAEAPQVIEEIIISGTVQNTPEEMTEETERLFSVAGAAFDPLQAIYAMPGVTFSADGEPVIRGSAPQDNAYYIDDVPARYLFHIFGNSIFNKNLIHRFDLYPAAFPSRYGHATGGVLDVTLRDPRNQPFTTTLTWSFLLAGAMVESRLSENQAFYASYRRSQIDMFIREDDVDEEDGITVDKLPVSDDYQLKYRWDINDQHQLLFIAAGANDLIEASFSDESNAAERDPDNEGPASYEQGFDSQGLIWNWVSADGDSSVRTRLTHIGDYLDLNYGVGQFLNTRASRVLLRSDYSQRWLGNHRFTVGAGNEMSRYTVDANAKIVPCSDFDPDCPTLDAVYIRLKDKLTVNTQLLYLEDNLPLFSDRHWLTIGLHYSADDYLHEQRLEPRLRWDYLFADNWSTHIAAGQYSRLPELDEMLHTIGNPELTTVKADHYVWGIEQQASDDWRWTVELYYKDLQDVVISISNPADPDYGQNYSNDAKGRAYGLELQVNKNLSNNWYGWVALTLGKAERTNLRTGETRPFDYDRPLMLDIAANYLLTERWTLGIKWSLQSGGMYTPIVDIQPNATQPSVMEPVYGEYNSERLPYYHRLDFRAEYLRPTGFGYWSFFVDVLNVYNQKNITGYDYAANGEDTLSKQPDGFGDNVPVRASTALGFFPSIGFEIQF